MGSTLIPQDIPLADSRLDVLRKSRRTMQLDMLMMSSRDSHLNRQISPRASRARLPR